MAIRSKKDYIHWLAKKATSDYSSLKVLVDCANGSASYVAPGPLSENRPQCDLHQRLAERAQHQCGLRFDPFGRL
jgi:phosphomannomutase